MSFKVTVLYNTMRLVNLTTLHFRMLGMVRTFNSACCFNKHTKVQNTLKVTGKSNYQIGLFKKISEDLQSQ